MATHTIKDCVGMATMAVSVDVVFVAGIGVAAMFTAAVETAKVGAGATPVFFPRVEAEAVLLLGFGIPAVHFDVPTVAVGVAAVFTDGAGAGHCLLLELRCS